MLRAIREALGRPWPHQGRECSAPAAVAAPPWRGDRRTGRPRRARIDPPYIQGAPRAAPATITHRRGDSPGRRARPLRTGSHSRLRSRDAQGRFTRRYAPVGLAA